MCSSQPMLHDNVSRQVELQFLQITLQNPCSTWCTTRVGTHAGNDLLDDLLLHGLEHRLLLTSSRGSRSCSILRQAAAGSCMQKGQNLRRMQ